MRSLLIIAASLLMSAQAHAGIYLEPYLGYGVGTAKGTADVQGVGTQTINGDDKGFLYGAKAGYSILGFAFGADYFAGTLKETDKTVTPTTDSNVSVSNLGVFVQYSFPILFKVSATYIVSSTGKDDTTEFKGKGFKVGVGYTGLPFVSINVDYMDIKFDDITIPGLVLTNEDVKEKITMVSISLPLNL